MNILILPAAGIGARMGYNMPKALIPLNSKYGCSKQGKSLGISTIVESTAWIFSGTGKIDGIIVLATPSHVEEFKKLKFPPNTHILAGGATRKESVGIGVKSISKFFPKAEIVLIHDAARCFITPELIIKSINETKIHHAITCATKVTDTIARAAKNTTDKNPKINDYVPREDLWAIQTPQCFERSIIEKAHLLDIPDATDDTSLVASFYPVTIIEGEKSNIKVTFKEDLNGSQASVPASP